MQLLFFSVVCVSFMHIKFQVDKLLSDSHTMKGTTAVNFNLFIQSLVYFYRRRSWLILCFVLVFAEHCTFSIQSMRWGCFMSTNPNCWRNPNVGVFYPVSLLHGRLQKRGHILWSNYYLWHLICIHIIHMKLHANTSHEQRRSELSKRTRIAYFCLHNLLE